MHILKKYLFTLKLVGMGFGVVSPLLSFCVYADGGKDKALPQKYQSSTVPLRLDSAYIRSNAADDYWAIAPFYVGQLTEGTCGVATASMVSNAAFHIRQGLTKNKVLSDHENVHENGIFKWFNPMKIGADKGIKGISLLGFERVLKQIFSKLNLENYKITTFRGTALTDGQILDLLEKNERSKTDLLVALFWQADLTGDPEGAVGHFAPVGAYDAKQKRVLLFDPDRRWYEPYWVTFENFTKGIKNPKADSLYSGGLIYLEIQ